MAADYPVGSAALDVTLVADQVAKIGKRKFALKDSCLLQSINARKLQYFKETSKIYQAATNLAPGSEFPDQLPELNDATVNARIFALANNITWQDVITNKIDIFEYTVRKTTEAVVNAVEQHVYDVLNAAAGPTQAAKSFWDASVRSTRHPFDDIGEAVRLAGEVNEEVDTVLVTPLLAGKLMQNDDFKPTLSPSPKLVEQGETKTVGWLTDIGMRVLASTRATSDQALFYKYKQSVVFAEVEPLNADIEINKGRYYRVRVWNHGVAYVPTDANIVKITNVQE